MEFDLFLQHVWPWTWPTLLWLGLCVGGGMGFGWLGRMLARRVEAAGGSIDPQLRRRTEWLLTVVVAIGALSVWVRLAPVPEQLGFFARDKLEGWLWPTLGLALWLIAGNFLGSRVLEWLAHRAAASMNQLDDSLIAAIKRPFFVILLLTGLNLWAGLVPLVEALRGYLDTGTKAGVVFLLVLFADAFAQHWLANRSRSSKVLATSGGVLRVALRVVLYLVGVMMVLSALGVDVTPVLASLGIGSLAIGLALQKTLEDFFAGLQLAADQTVRVGDFVALEGGQSGEVLSIGWRTTQIRTLDDTHVIVPNSKLAQSILLNRSLPAAEMNLRVPVGVHYQSDLESVVRVALEVARAVQAEAPDAAPGYENSITFTAFADSAVQLNVWLRARSWDASFRLQDTFIRALHARFKEAGIVIPFPIRTLDLPPEVRALFRSRADGASPAPPGDRSPSETSA